MCRRYASSAVDHPDEEGKVNWDKPEYTLLDQVEGEITIRCEACYHAAVASHKEWESADSDPRDLESEKVAGSEVPSARCRNCRHEVD